MHRQCLRHSFKITTEKPLQVYLMLVSIIPGSLIIKNFLIIFYLSGLITSFAVYCRVIQTNLKLELNDLAIFIVVFHKK